MGFFDFFNSIFSGTKCQFKPEELDIDITDNAIIINGNRLELPCLLDDIAKLFGKPRASEPGANVIYTWDKLGIICYAKNGSKVVHCLSLRTIPREDWDFHPHSPYIGKIHINGGDWEQFMYSGKNTDYSRRTENENYVMNSSYSDMENGDENGCAGAYSGIEISIKL